MNTNLTPNGSDGIANWNGYSESFQSVMPSEMTNLNRAVSEHMYGRVADFGCGAGKIIPFVLKCKSVQHYTGIDSAPEMVARARWMAGQIDDSKVTLKQSKIEEVELVAVDSGLSINSYYVWPDPVATLNHIFQQLKPGATFVLATINDDIDMPALLGAATPEMIAHPHWDSFKEHNISICKSPHINLTDLDSLIGQVRNVGFKVVEAHAKWYMGGLNTVVLKRKDSR